MQPSREPPFAPLRTRLGWAVNRFLLLKEGAMSSVQRLVHAADARRDHARVTPANATQQGQRYPDDPPTVDEIVAVMRQTPADSHGLRLRALIVVVWRGGLWIQEALSLLESDLDPRRGSMLIR